jgi:HPt (histidine-containing phosphotransfer) domain-containing protein
MSDEKIIIQVDPDLEELIPGFLENRNSDVEKLRSALDDNDFENLRSIGHSIKGVGGGYGFDLMSELGADIESAAKESNADEIREKINQLDDYLQRVEIEYA